MKRILLSIGSYVGMIGLWGIARWVFNVSSPARDIRTIAHTIDSIAHVVLAHVRMWLRAAVSRLRVTLYARWGISALKLAQLKRRIRSGDFAMDMQLESE